MACSECMGRAFVLIVVILQCGAYLGLSADKFVSGVTRTKTQPNASLAVDGKALPVDQLIEVYVGFYLENIGNFFERTMDLELDMTLRLSWIDKQLRHNDTTRIIRSEAELGEVWMPDLYFLNARNARYHDIMHRNLAMWIEGNGTVAYSTRLNPSLSCPMDFTRYPQDTQTCDILISSYTMNNKLLLLSWFGGQTPIVYDHDLDMPDFQLLKIDAEHCDRMYNYSLTMHGYRQGEFSCLRGRLELRRKVGDHIVHSYIPTAMIVVLSWSAFWIDPAAVPARITLTFTTLLAISTQGTSLQLNLPPVAYVKAIDVWFGTCMMFIFACLLEYVAVNHYMRQATKLDKVIAGHPISRKYTIHPYKAPDMLGKDAAGSMSDEDAKSWREGEYRQLAITYQLQAQMIDKISRVAFPSTFFLFVAAYVLAFVIF